MKSFLSCCILIAFATVFTGKAQTLPSAPPTGWNGTLYDYADYNLTRYFTDGNLSGGTFTQTTGSILNAAPGFLNFDCSGGQSGNRISRYNLGGAAVASNNKLIVEFDYASTNFTGTAVGEEAIVAFRNGTNNLSADVLFTLFNVRGTDNQLGIAVGQLAGDKAAAVGENYRAFIPFTPSKWYHIKVEIYPAQRICFHITDGETYNRQLMFTLPSGFPASVSITNIHFQGIRNANNMYWRAGVGNLGIKSVSAQQEATGVTIRSDEDQIGLTGSTSLFATVEPWDVYDHNVTWSGDNDLATVTAGVPSWTATLRGANAGFGSVTVTATSATAGIIGTKIIDIVDLKLSNIVISGANTVSLNHTVQLSANVFPEGASNLGVIWSSDDDDIATVNSVTGEVTGVQPGVASIRATAADGGGAFNTYQVAVVIKPVEEIDLHGERRIFYEANPATIAPFDLIPIITPADASVQTLNWSSTDETIATVNASGKVTLAGGFGKVAVKAAATDGSGVERYYYMETGATNPYNVFSDFETSASPFNATGQDVGGNRTLREIFQGSQTIHFYTGENTQGATRWLRAPLVNAITGRLIHLRFDWWAGQVRGAANTGILSIQDDMQEPLNSIFSLVYCASPAEEEYGRFRYYTGNYELSGSNPPIGQRLENIDRFDRWYTIDIGIDFQSNTCSFTITDRDEPSITETVTKAPLSPVDAPNPRIAQMYFAGLYNGTGLMMRTAIDNFAYQVVDASPPSYVVTGLKIEGLEQIAPGGKIMLYPRFIPERATNKTLTFVSSNPDIATIEIINGNYIVTGISEGTATITLTSVENKDIFAEKTIAVHPSSIPQRQMERLNRGLVAVRNTGANTGVFLSWRLFATDPENIRFNIYKNNGTSPVNSSPLLPSYTNFTDPAGTVSDTYSVAALLDEREISRSEPVNVWGQQYLEIPVQKPTTGKLNTTGAPYPAANYTIYDGVVADLDGDGEYEIVFMWAPNNLRDNAHEGETGTVFIDAYKLDGKKLWGDGKYIDLGPNIRAGAHYLQLLAYDFDGCGKAEIIARVADGAMDATGTVIGDPDVRYANSAGRVLAGPEWVAVFEGATGKLLDHKPYVPERGAVGSWGDTHGNRVDRFLSAVAYLDGVHPSAVLCRGYYARSSLTAWDWDGKDLTVRWVFDTRPGGILNPALQAYEGQGNHNLGIADVDGDGKDDIIYGAMTVKSDGTPLYSTGFNHGDAMHIGKFIPDRPGLQVMSCRESPNPWGVEMHDAMTGDLIWGERSNNDVGRGLTANIDPAFQGTQSWGSTGMPVKATDGTTIGATANLSMNMAIWWDGDTGRELFDGGANPSVTKPSGGGTPPTRSYSNPAIFTFSGTSTNGGTKNNPCLQADILGDWREEIILRGTNDNSLRIYTTTTPTVHTGAGAIPASGIPTLMHDPVYRMAIAWQNTGYNQPPETGFFLGYNMEDVPRTGGAVINVTIDPNGGTFADHTSAAKQFTTISGAYFKIPDVSRPEIDGSIFHGWYLNEDVKYDPVAIYQEDISLKAKWTPVAYIISFDANAAGMNNPKSKIVEPNTAIGALPILTRTGFTLAGWYPNPDGTGGAFTETTIYDLESSIILFAHWTPKTYILSFSTQTTEVANPENLNVYYDTEVGELPVPSRTGYTFGGWFINENGTGAITETTVYRYDRNMILYAKWTPNTYTLEFNANAAGITHPESKQVTYDAAVGALPVLSRAGFNFTGWNAASNGSGETYTAVTLYRMDGNLTLYAVWTSITGVPELVWDNLKVYPNPASNLVTITGLKGGELISFLDAAGRLCIQTKATGLIMDINLRELTPGNYLVKIETVNAEKTVKLIVK